MRLRVRLFAAFRERAGAATIDVTVADDATMADVARAVVAEAPALSAVIEAARPVVNHEFVDRGYRVRAGDDLALLPPVSGGA